MKSSTRSVLLLAVLLMLAPLAGAQDDSQHTPIVLGDFTLSGSTTAGYRFTDVKGFQPEYQEMINLNKGFRVLDFSLYGEANEGKNPFADEFSLQLGSLGGEPFDMAQFAICKKHLYDFRANWRQSYFYWNQNDNVVLPIVAVAAFGAISKGLTANQIWGTVRKFGSADLTLHATNNLRFNFDYYRPSDQGNTFTSRGSGFLRLAKSLGHIRSCQPLRDVRSDYRQHEPLYRWIRLYAEELDSPLFHRLSDVHGKCHPE